MIHSKAIILSACVLILGINICCTEMGSVAPPGNIPVVFQLNWIPDPTFAGAYIAASSQTNIFAQEGLYVNIYAGGIGIDPIAAVVNRSAQFAVVGADKAVVAHANGAPIRVVAVEFQRNPVGWIVRKELGIYKISDAVDREDVILGDKIGSETTAILNLMLNRTNLHDILHPRGVGYEFSYFINNDNVIYPVYLNEEPVTAHVMGIDVIEIDPSLDCNGNIRMYGNVIITHQEYVREHSRQVQAFISGLSRGWQYAKNNMEAAEMILLEYTEFDVEQMPEVLRRSVDYATSYYGISVPPGHMEIAVWNDTIALLREGGVLNKDVDISELVWFGEGH